MKDEREKKQSVKGKERLKKSGTSTPCESCEFYDADEYGDYSCIMNLDEDEFANFAFGNTSACPYYRFYDEYKFVQKQN